MSIAQSRNMGWAAIVLGWLGLLLVAVTALVLFERQRLSAELQAEAEILHREASQRADQHDAHLTSLSALAVASAADRQVLFLEVAATILRFYPRIAAVDLVPLDRPDRYVTTRPGLSDRLAGIIVAGARASHGELVLRPDPEADGRYLVIKRSPNTDAARFGLALTVDVETMLASDDDFWTRPSVTRSLALPGGRLLFGTPPGDAAMRFAAPLGSGSQPLVFEAGMSPQLADLLPAGQSLRPAAVLIGLLPGKPGPSVLLTRRHEAMTHHAGQIAFPGGRREPGDPGWLDTASREAEEEVGVPRAQVNPLGLLAPYATISGFTVTPVVAWLEGEFDRVAQDTEVAEIFEAPLSWLVDPQRRRWEKIHWRGRERGYWVIDYQQYRIWGATAAMLVDLARTLEQR